MRNTNESTQNLGADLRRVVKKYGENKEVALIYGTVIGVKPIEILVDGTTDALQAAGLTVSLSLTNQSVQATFNGTTSTMTIENALKRGERVAMLSDTAHDRIYVVERATDGQ